MNGEPATCDGEHTTGLNARYVGTTSDGQHGETPSAQAAERRGRETKMATQASRDSVVREGPGKEKGNGYSRSGDGTPTWETHEGHQRPGPTAASGAAHNPIIGCGKESYLR